MCRTTFLHNEQETNVVNGYDSKGSNGGAVAEILGDVYIKSAEVDCRHIQAFPVDTMKTLVSIRLRKWSEVRDSLFFFVT